MTSLLPPNRSPLETAISETIAARFPRPTPAVRTVFDPMACPAELLPFLAWHLSIDLWDDRWDELKKRQVCRDALKLHALKTTLAGIKAHVALTGAEVVKAIRPPAKTFLYPAMTEDQRRAWLDSLPQIRFYPFLETAIVRRRFFYRRGPRSWPELGFDSDGASWTWDASERLFDMAGPDAAAHRRPAYFGAAWYRTTRGPDLLGTRTTYWDRGEERPIKMVVPEAGISRLLVPRQTRRSWYGKSHYGADWYRFSQGRLGVVTVRLSDDVGGYAVAAGLKPVDVRPIRISEKRTPPAARAFWGRRTEGTYMRTTAAPRFIYDRVSLHDPDRMGARRRARSFYGHARFGMPAFSAELHIRVPMHRPRWRAARWYGSGYLCAPDMRPLHQAIRAVSVSKAFRDTITINTRFHERVRFSGGLRFGDFTFGEIREIS